MASTPPPPNFKSASLLQSSQLEDLITRLKKDSPKSELIIATVHNIVRGKLESDVFTNGWPDFSAVVCQYRDPLFGWFFVCYASNSEDLASLLNNTAFVQTNNWIILVEDVHVEKLTKVHGIHTVITDDVTTLYHLPQASTLLESRICCDDGFILKKLEERHAQVVAESWNYSEDTLSKEALFRDMIKNYHSAGIFVEGGADEPIAWCMQYAYGPLAHLYVTEEYRKRGFASLLAKHVLKCVRDDGFLPLANVDKSNVSGKKLMEKLGMVEHDKVTYLKSMCQ